MKFLFKSTFFFIAMSAAISANAENYIQKELDIKSIRSVGNYSAGSTYDNIIELHFNTNLQWPSGSGCTNAIRVMIDASNTHLVSAAFMAYASDMKITVNVDDALPIRGGACEVSYLDVIKP